MFLNYRALTFILGVFLLACSDSDQVPEKLSKEERIKFALEEDFMRTYDPALGYPPKERLYTALQETRRMQREMESRRSADGLEAKFIERGPFNVGGRTRTLHIDYSDPERKTIWAGGVAGGLYRTDDITADPLVWNKVDDFLDNLAVGALAQDPNNPDAMYLGTGEGFVNSDAVRGIGILKSTDHGKTWELLPSTTASTYRFTRAMLVHPETGHVYAATRNGGVRRSEDGGQTWTKVLGISITASNDDMYDLYYVDGTLYASNSENIYSSQTGGRGEWMSITQNGSGFPTDLNRVEFSVCLADPNIIYAVGSRGGSGSDIYKTLDGGMAWQTLDAPGGNDFTNGQAWYDLEIAVDPFNCGHVIVGGVPIYRSGNGGASWTRFAENMHVDQHKVLFDEENEGVIYFGNDGGVYRSENGSALNVPNRNLGYITSQYYACALHPDTFSNYILGGTQDNGSHQLNDVGVASARHVWGGDGFLCHIDQNEPRYQLVSSQFGNWGLSVNEGQTFSGGQNTNGGFLTPADYDDETGILYSQTFDGGYYRWNVKKGDFVLVNFTNAGGRITTVATDPNIPNRVYFGNNNGTIFRVDNADTLETVEEEILYDATGTVSSIDVFYGDPDHIIATFSNYGIEHSVVVSSNGGMNWESAEGNLPDMPVRWGIFSPTDPTSALIGTEAGVWSTESLSGIATQWAPPPPGEGTPLTRTDMLQMRRSDFVVLAATHGRGMWTSGVFAEPRPKFLAPAVHYINSPLRFLGEVSLNADSYFWEFGDGATAEVANPEHTFTEIGEYPVTLTINGELSTSLTIKILPEVELPYVKGEPEYGGSFEGMPEQYGIHTLNGTAFERGRSEITGKKGTRSGDQAFVIGVNEQFYAPNTHTVLYLPSFDFSDLTIYNLSFWAAYDIDPGPDGFLLEYSQDLGRTWTVLGKKESGWYTFNNDDITTSAFPSGTSYFTGVVGGFTNYSQNISFLAGQSDVAFRFVFRSGADGFHPGVAIDDFEISKFEGELATTLTHFDGDYTDDREITLEWSTRPEYYCQKFEIEESINGRDFEKIGETSCKGGLSDATHNYEFETSGGRSLYFYRLKVISEDEDSGYALEYYSDTINVRIRLDGLEVFRVFPNPFINQIHVTFTDVVNQDVAFRLFDSAGKLIAERMEFVDGVFYTFEAFQLPVGTYYFGIRIGEKEEVVYPVLAGIN